MRMTTVLAGAALLLAGCDGLDHQTGGDLVEGQASRIMVPGATFEQVLAAAERAVSDLYGLARTSEGRIVSQPQAADVATGTVVAMSSRTAMRKVATVQVRSEGGFARAYARVDVQRRQTREFQVYHSMMSDRDVPHDTPLEQGAALKPEQREVWVTARRDIAAEEALLEEIRARLGPAGAANPAPAQP